jgi:hypothetical protein
MFLAMAKEFNLSVVDTVTIRDMQPAVNGTSGQLENKPLSVESFILPPDDRLQPRPGEWALSAASV